MEESFGLLLRRFRARAGLNISELAEALGAARASVRAWEQDQRYPRDRARLEDLAQVLNLSSAEAAQFAAAARSRRPAAALSAQASEPADLAATPARACALRHQLRTPIPDFVGQQAAFTILLEAFERTSQDGRVATICGVQGMGGTGKTELAVLVANHLIDAFPDAQIMLNLRGTSTDPLPVAQALQQIVYAFTPDAKVPDELDALQRYYRTVLHGQRVLILADDARDAAQVRPLLPPAGCALLVTSRQRFTLPGMTSVDLELLTEAEASTLLRSICTLLDDEEARALARACGYLPLSLRISGSVLHNDPALPIVEYLARLVDERQRLAALRDPDDPQLDAQATLALSYALLETASRQTFRQLGVLVADFDTSLALSVVAAPDGVDVEAVLRSLLRHNLVIYDLARGRWRLHDLLRDLARAELEAAGEPDAAQWRYAGAAIQIARETQARYLDGGDGSLRALARFDAERPHIDAACRWVQMHAGMPEGDQLLLDATVATRYIGMLRYDARRERIPLGELAVAAARRLGDGCGTAQVLHHLGNAYISLGQAQHACSYFEEAAAIARDSCDRHTEGRALHNLGVVYMQLGEVRRAICFLEQTLTTLRDQNDQQASGLALSNLSYTYAALGDAGRAITMCAQALAIQRALGNQRGEGIALCCLGHAHTLLGHPRRAIACCTQAAALLHKIGDRHSEGEALADLGHAYAVLGDCQRADESCEGALTIARSIGDQRLEGYALSYLAQAQAQQGDGIRATSAFAQALACFQAVDDRSGAAECQWHFGLALAQQAEREQALPLLCAAVAYQEEIGHTQAAAQAELLARLEAGEIVPPELLYPARQRTI